MCTTRVPTLEKGGNVKLENRDQTINLQKVEVLSLWYPSYDRSVLKELLAQCQGSLDGVRILIDGPNSVLDEGKRKRGVLYQSAISAPAKKVKPNEVSDKRSKVIRLHTEEQVRQYLHPYVSLHKSFLSKEQSESILSYLMGLRHRITPKTFYIADNFCTSHHGSSLLAPQDDVVSDMIQNIVYNGKTPKVLANYNTAMAEAEKKFEHLINDNIRKEIDPLPFQSTEEWKSSFCVVNYFENCKNHLDFHSDRLSHVGPHNFIASLSLGATREFRVKELSGNKMTYSIVLPHNCAVIMQPGCQEEFKHGVNALRVPMQQHPISGNARFNLTFRNYRLSFLKNLPTCKCNITMTLRRAFKKSDIRGKYFWTCENKYRNMDCGTFYWADFNNVEGHFVAKTDDDVSSWVPNND